MKGKVDMGKGTDIRAKRLLEYKFKVLELLSRVDGLKVGNLSWRQYILEEDNVPPEKYIDPIVGQLVKGGYAIVNDGLAYITNRGRKKLKEYQSRISKCQLVLLA